MTIDKVRDFWDRRPCNLRHSTKPVGTIEYFNEVEKRKYFVEPHIPGFADFTWWAGKSVLELGCGLGTDSINFARAGADLTVVELSPRSLALCKERFGVFRLPAVFYNGDMEQLHELLPPQKFDLVYAFGSIHHTTCPEAVFKQLLRYCHPDTELRVMVYSRWSWKVLVDIIMKSGKGAFWQRSKLVRKYSEAQTGSPETYDYSFKGVRRLMEDFEVTSISKAHIFPYVVEKYVKHEYEKEWYFRIMPRRTFAWLERRLGWHTLIVAKPRRTIL